MARTKGAKKGIYGNKIDKENFEKLCSILCTEEEICGFFSVSHDTLSRWIKQKYGEDLTFKEVFLVFSAKGKISLRRTQFDLAKNNPSMAIFLGKQYLGQKDVVEEKETERIEVVNDVPKVDDIDA